MGSRGAYERVPLNESAADAADDDGDVAAAWTGASSSTSSAAPASSRRSSGAAGPPAQPPSAVPPSEFSLGSVLSSLWPSLWGTDPELTPVESARRFGAALRLRYGEGLPPADPPPSSSSVAAASASSSGASSSSRVGNAVATAPAPPPGPGPRWMEAAFQEAIQAADTQCKPLLIYLHSDLHEDMPSFVRDGLFSHAVASLVNTSFLPWGGSIHARDGAEAADAFQAVGFPYVGVFAAAAGSTPARPKFTRVWTHEGGLTGPDLLQGLATALATANDTLGGIAAERTARDFDRRLREEQDRRFREAEDIDRQRALERAASRKAAADAEAEARRREAERQVEEAAAKAKEEEAAELEEAIALSRTLDTEQEVAAARARLEGHPEPPEQRGVTTNLRLTLPSGAKLQRRFGPGDSVGVLRDWVFVTSHELGPALPGRDSFDLTCAFPRRTFTPGPGDDGLDMKGSGLHPQAVLFVTERAPPTVA